MKLGKSRASRKQVWSCGSKANIGTSSVNLGRVVIQEFPINETRTAPPHSALFSVNMLVGTENGRCYSPKKMKRWLAETGFNNIVIKYLPETVLIMGVRKD
jgi:hypothetical protein